MTGEKLIRFKEHPYYCLKKGSYTVGKHIFLRWYYKTYGYNRVFSRKAKNHLKQSTLQAYKVMLLRLKGATLEETARRIGKSRERVRQIEAKEFQKLKSRIKTEDDDDA